MHFVLAQALEWPMVLQCFASRKTNEAWNPGSFGCRGLLVLGAVHPAPRAIDRSVGETRGAPSLRTRLRLMHRTPDDLREIATHCRYLASSCLTEQAREPLRQVADDLEREAEIQEEIRQKFFAPS